MYRTPRQSDVVAGYRAGGITSHLDQRFVDYKCQQPSHLQILARYKYPQPSYFQIQIHLQTQ